MVSRTAAGRQRSPVLEAHRQREHGWLLLGPDAVPPGQVFLLGDNRDSRRIHDVRSVDLDDVDGRVLVKVWPLG